MTVAGFGAGYAACSIVSRPNLVQVAPAAVTVKTEPASQADAPPVVPGYPNVFANEVLRTPPVVPEGSRPTDTLGFKRYVERKLLTRQPRNEE